MFLAFLEYMNHLLLQLYLFGLLLSIGIGAIVVGAIVVATVIEDFRNPPIEE